MRTLGLALFLLCAAAQAQDAPKVVKIDFEGNKRYTDDFLRQQIATKVGQPLDNGELTRDTRLLRRFFATVLDVEVKKVEGGVEIVFMVLDEALVGEVRVLGSQVEKSDYEPLMATRRRRPLLDYSIESDRDMLARLHSEKGYYFVSVQVERKKSSRPNMEDVTFIVIPNNQVKVTDIVLEGAHSLPVKLLVKNLESAGWATRRKARNLAKPVDDTLLSRVLTAPYYWIRSLFDSSYYKKETVHQDRRRIEDTYRKEGFLDAKVVLVGVKFDAKRERAQIHFRVDEGARYTVAKVTVEYAEGGLPDEADREFLSAETLNGLVLLIEGAPYRWADIEASQRAVQERLWGRAYAKSTVEIVVRPVGEKKEVNVRYVVRAGGKVRLGEIRVIGNRYTRDNVIRRSFRDGAQPGDYLDIEALEEGMQRLRNLRYFRFVRYGRRQQWGLVPSVSGRPDEYDVEIVVDELDRTRQLEIGGSIDTDGGAVFRLSVRWRNFDIGKPPDRIWDVFSPDAFRGGGQEFNLSLQPGTRNSTFSIGFTDPRVNDSVWSLSSRIYRTISTQTQDYDTTTDGLLLRVGRYLDDQFRWYVAVEYDLRQVLLDNPAPDAPVNALDDQGTTAFNGIGISLRRVVRREQYAFLVGHVSNVRGWIYGGFGAEIAKLHFDHKAGWRLWRNTKGYHRVLVRFSVDWATAYGATDSVPIYERYFLGGNNLRGFEFREVGPRSNGRPTGGDFRTILSMEYTIPMVGKEDGVGIDFVLFLDQGGLSDSLDTWTGEDWRISAGFGVAVSFELGGGVQPPLYIYFGWPIRKQAEDRKRLITVEFVRTF